ncbi:hypothetical protein TrVE_jg4926 [Triparma verrucosa]|uniref:Uncharacterized protein n=1 Tax=Triparma verrucosa TaxID=1606542 RepID=A0A9W7KVD7_9STRA|nr:hypothetical protein TrVE_jg4926 [Triparma verrucosa]
MLERTLYRSILRLSRTFDATGPSLTSLIHRSDNVQDFSHIEDVQERDTAQKYQSILNTYLSSSSSVLLTPSASKSLNLAEMTKEQFNNNASTNTNLDVAFLCLKELNNKLHWHKNLIQNAQPLPEIKASLSEELSAGKFLLSHPLLSGFFSRSVIALTEVNEEESQGYVVNKIERGDNANYKNAIVSFSGGPRYVNEYSTLKSLETLCDVEVSRSKFVKTAGEGFYVGGDIDDCLSSGGRVGCSSGVTVWGEGQLQDEIDKGFWIVVDSDLDIFDKDLARHLTWSGILKGAGFEGMGRMGEGAKVREEEEEIGWEDDECVVDAPSDVHVL